MHTDLEFLACLEALRAHALLLSLGFTDWIAETTYDSAAEAEYSTRRYRKREKDGRGVMVDLWLQDDGGEPYPVGVIKHVPFVTERAYPVIEICRLYPEHLPLLGEFVDYARKAGEAMRAIPFPSVSPVQGSDAVVNLAAAAVS